MTGTLGDSAAGLAVINDGLDQGEFSDLVDRYYLPQPRLSVAQNIAPLASSMMDVSDGLVGDMAHICRHSGVGAAINAQKIPLSGAFGNLLATKAEYSEFRWNGGDDYELLFTADAKNDHLIDDISEKSDVKLTKIGKITEGLGVKLLNDEGAEIDVGDLGFRHF